MIFIQDDPDVKALHAAHKANNKEEVERLNKIVRANVDQRLESLQGDANVLQEEMNTISEEPSLPKQYRKSIDLYREIVSLLDNIRIIKKSIREEMYKK